MLDILNFLKIRRSQRAVAPATASLCPTCSALNITALLRDGLPKSNVIPLGYLPDILRKADECRFCYLVATLIRRSWRLDTQPNVDLSGVECSLWATIAGALENPRLEDRKQCHRLRIDSERPTVITSTMLVARADLTLDIQLLDEDAHKFRRAKEVHGRRMGETIDMALAKTWLALCERAHGDACGSAWWRGSDVRLPPFVRVVDVTLMSVVRAPSDCRFVALSYVWGTAGNDYWTTKANVDSRAQTAGLDPSVLPATIMDSIRVTQALGERYLWIDALCIIQDSPDDKSDQIGVMEMIYSGAILTIVAAGGESAHARLPGLSPGSRSVQQHIEVIQDLHLAIPLPSLGDAIAQTIWDRRGWTFQELLLSRRRLFFTKHQVYFECAKDVWCEDLVAESKTVLYSYHPMRLSGSIASYFWSKSTSSGLEHILQSYARFVDRYSQRHLTYPADVLDAVSALTSAMTKAYKLPGGDTTQAFRYAMLVWNLDYSLLWQPRLDSAHVRRVSSDTGLAAWPSWAWAGWIGAVYYSDLNQLMTQSAAIWTTAQAKPEESLVRGWYVVDNHRQLVRLQVEKISFVSIEGPNVARSRYQIPSGDIDKQQLEPLPPAGTLIFRTQCASFRVSKLENTSSNSKPLPQAIFLILSDARQPSARVGRMILPSSTPSPMDLEFIVLARSGDMDMRGSGFYEESVYGDPYDACLVHVMAVRRVGHDARMRERVGLGVVFEQAWLACGAEVETVLLG